MKNNKILYIESGTTGGGSFECLYQHINAFRENHKSPIVVCFNKTRYNRLWEEAGAKVFLVNDPLYTIPNTKVNKFRYKLLHKLYKYTLLINVKLFVKFLSFCHKRTIRRIERIIIKENISCIELNDQIQRDLFALELVKKHNLKCISHLRSIRGSSRIRKIIDYANKYVDHYISVSSHTEEYWLQIGISPSKSDVIFDPYDFSNIDLNKTNLHSEFNIEKRFDVILGCVANFSDAKGHSFLLKSFKEVIGKYKNVCLLLVGYGQLMGEMKIEAKALGILENVIFAGYKNDILDIINSLDIILIPSKSEGLPRVAIEAMYCKTPIISTDVGGIPEIIQDHKNGILVTYGKIPQLAKKITKLLTDKELKIQLVENGYQNYEHKFNINKYKTEMNKIYSKIVCL